MNYASLSRIVLVFLACWSAVPDAVSVEKFPRSIADLAARGRPRERVLVQGELRRRIDFDLFVVEDAGGQMALSFEGLRHDLKVGDRVTAMGRFQGRYVVEGKLAKLEVLKFAPAGTPEAAALTTRFGDEPPAPPAASAPADPAAATPAPARGIESRLRELDELREKKLVTPEEYKDLRRKILDEL